MILVCPKCDTENRIPDPPDPTKRYRCGKCKTVLASIPRAQDNDLGKAATGRVSLAEHLNMEAVGSLVEKKMFGGYEVRVGPFLMLSLWVFQKGAILGRALRDRLDILAKLLAEEGRERNVCSFIREVAVKQVDDYGKEPDSFYDFWMDTELKKLDFSDLNLMKQLVKKKARLGEMLPKLDIWLVQGIGFGATFPELTERLWKEAYETYDPHSWAEARSYGLDIPQQPAPLPLEEMEQIVLSEVAEYANEFFPELVEPLGLRLT